MEVLFGIKLSPLCNNFHRVAVITYICTVEKHYIREREINFTTTGVQEWRKFYLSWKWVRTMFITFCVSRSKSIISRFLCSTIWHIATIAIYLLFREKISWSSRYYDINLSLIYYLILDATMNSKKVI